MLGAIGAWLLSVGGEEERHRPRRHLAGSRVLSAPQSCRVFQPNLTRQWHRGQGQPPTTGGRAGEATTLGDAELAAFCLRRLRDNPRFAAL
ncbi:hypothetical protein HPB50_017602 [Hyalomma asiaticum]|uniref:Uncharacterized protein n=1 Tax=Hyalomma asiaticum TaxID=266040 RepID=A0ACB7TLW3_HYAAI|nr:hypothetical protein HPB50_017602 [Hyalomma asiaticum]